MTRNWMTQKVSAQPTRRSPSGDTEIRLLPSFAEGEIAHATALPGKPSHAATLTGIGELWYILKGEGELWRATGKLEHVATLHPGRCVLIPPGIAYQYRALGAR